MTFKQLQRTLNEFGFEKAREKGNHVIFRHSEKGVIVVVPNIGDTVRPVYVRTAARQIANSGIATVSTFVSRLEKTAKEIDK